MINDLITKIQEAQVQAYKKGIETNAVLLNDKYDYCREFVYMFTNHIYNIPPMILGKEVIAAPLPEEYSFALTHVANISKDIQDLHEKINILTKYIKVQGEGENAHLVFKGVSSKKNKKDFEKIVSLVDRVDADKESDFDAK